MTDRIELRGLRVLGHHGALEGEQDTAQPFEVDLEVEAELGDAARDDELGKTVDYSLVVETARSIVAGRRYRLLEALAAAIAQGVLEISAVQAVTVTVRKLRPPVAADLGSAGVRLRRERGDGFG
ncbi:MAG TPA: dihydroneopterin aldolase [Acidimicrobiales bacterium]|nr:dihydroneopterin aldolase [Acidimicrobiales bacterium]